MNKYKVENKMKRWEKSYTPIVSFISAAILICIWEAICRSGFVSALFLPAPTTILKALFQMIQDGEIGVSLTASLYRILMGFFLGGAFGLLRGALLCFVAFALLPLIQTVVPVAGINDLVAQSALAPLFNSGNLILAIMNGKLF